MAGKKDIVEQALKLIIGAGEEAASKAKLPMDLDNRMYRASEMGFDPTRRYYHLTRKDFDAFKLGADPSSHTGGGAIWLREDPRYNISAHQVPSFEAEGARDIPLFIRPTKELPTMEWSLLRQQGKLNDQFPLVVTPEENKMLRDMGYSHASLGGETVVFDPKDLRSPHAVFDPDEAESADYMKSSGGSIREGYQTKGRVVGDIVDQALKLIAGGVKEGAPKAAIRAYHASPHDFDKFEWSPRTFGTGEGAQSYGAGLYFAESPSVSGRGGTYDQQFTRKLKEMDRTGELGEKMGRVKIGGRPSTEYGIENDPGFIDAVKAGNVGKYAREKLDRWHELSTDENYPYRDYATEKMRAWEKLLNDYSSGADAYYPTKSRIYEVDINARPAQLLDWDAPIKEQSGEIQRAVGNLPVNRPLSNYSVIGEPVQIDPYPNAPPALKAKLVALDGGVPYTVDVRTPEGGIVKIKGATSEEAISNANEYAGKAAKDLMSRTGGDLVKSLERGNYSIPDRTAKLNATGSLYKEGIPGLRYLDAGSRSGNVADPTRNYVIWNDELIDLKKKYEHGGRIAKGPGGWLDDVVKMAGKVISGEGEEAAKAGIRAYHGSPHDFPAERLVRMPSGQTEYLVGQPDVLPDVPEGAEVLQDFPLGRMRMDKIGTGVGAPDAFSRGLYFSEAEKNAQHFKELGASPMIGGRKSRAAELSPDANEAVWNFVHAQGKSGTLADVAAEAEADLAARAKELPFSARRDYQRVIDELKARGQEDVRLGAHMYEVDINADPASFAEWDTPISQQSEIVQNALSEFPKEKTWRDVYESGRIRPSDMLKRGVSGTEFKANDGTRNYVVFDDKLISIIRKYGIAGASAMLGYNLMEQLDPKQALAASMADQDYQASRPRQSAGGNNAVSGALNVARGLNGVK